MNSSHKLRTGGVLLTFVMLYGIALAHLYSIAISQKDFYTNLAQRQYQVTVRQRPPRAPIFDRNGNYLALNKDRYAAFVLPRHVKNREQLANFLSIHFPHALHRLAYANDKQFLYIARNLTDAECETITNADNPDIHVLSEPGRWYPVPEAGIIVGLTDVETEGIMGIEQQCNHLLSGTPTVMALNKDARSGHFYFEKETTQQGADGTPVSLSIDSNLQFLITQELKTAVSQFNADEASAVVMDPFTGQIIAMATYPHFDPNDTRTLDIQLTKNKPVTDAYELGSVIKIFAALAALDENVVNPEDEINCENALSTRVKGVRVNTWRAHDVLSFQDVILKSNNIGIAKVVQPLGPKLYEHYTKIGFGEKTDIEFPGEHQGFVNHPDNWQKPSLCSLSYGYEISATLIQVAKALSCIANGGYDIQPTLLLQKNELREQLYRPETIAKIKETITRPTPARLGNVTIFGKTGTANLVVNGKYSAKNSVYTFAGIVQKDEYKRVIVTFVKNAHSPYRIYATQVALPLFERIAERVLIAERQVSTAF